MNFWKEFQKLVLDYPVPQYSGINNTNFEGDSSSNCDNSYMCFDSVRLTNCAYIYDSESCTDCMDLDFSGSCENSFMGFGYKCNNSSYFSGDHLLNCHFMFHCGNCQDCFGCVGLENQQYCFFNRKMDRESYEKAVAEYRNGKSDEDIMNDLMKLAENYPLPPNAAVPRKDSNSDYADDIYRCQNAYMSFNMADSQNVLYAFYSGSCNDCIDISYCGKCDNCYNCVGVNNSNSTFHSYFSHLLLECMYCYYCHDCQNCIGCVGLDGKKFCVLNRQVSEEKYKEIRDAIMKNPNIEVELN